MEGMRREMQRREPELSVRLPEIGERYGLKRGKPAKRVATGRIDVQQAVGRDWQNSYAEFATGLKERLGHIRDERRRQKAIEEMRRVLDSYAEFKEERKSRAKR
jgi:metallo-beta-lactamase family protein